MTRLPHLARAARASADASAHGRHAEIVVHDGPLRQTVIAIRQGVELGEHNSPPAASLLILEGRVRVTGQDEVEMSAGEMSVLTHARHAVLALEDTVFLLTTVTGVPDREH